MELRDYQKKLIDEVTEAFKTNKTVCLSSAPGTGKTMMALNIALNWPGVGKIGVSAHGQTILKSQFIERAKQAGIPVNTPESRITVFLPQSQKNKDEQFDLLIVDEAHERYFEKEMQTVKTNSKCKKILLLTGTPSKLLAANERFIKKDKTRHPKEKIHIVAMGLLEVPEKHTSRLFLQMSQCSYDFKETDYNSQGDLRSNVYINHKKTPEAVRGVLEAMHTHLVHMGDFPGVADGFAAKLASSSRVLARSITDALGKTVIACHNAQQAKYVKDYFTEMGINVELSTAELDNDSELFDKFIENQTTKILIVLRRGLLGFDFDKLRCFVDFSGTRNPDRIYQMMTRVIRVDPTKPNQKKLFVKVAAPTELDTSQIFLNIAINLMRKDFLIEYKGYNLTTIRVNVVRPPRPPGPKPPPGPPGPKPPPEPPVVDLNGLEIIDFMRQVYHFKNPDYVIVRSTSIKEIRAAIAGRTLVEENTAQEFIAAIKSVGKEMLDAIRIQ